MKRSSLLIPVLCLGALCLPACASKECYENQNTLPLAGFLSIDTHRQITVSNLSVFGIGAPNDSLLADNSSLSEIYLPLPPECPDASFVFRYDSEPATQPDTITFHYTTKPWFASEACGVVYYYYIDSLAYSRNSIDSVAVPGMLITNANRRFIEIYFREEESGR